jgi:hypothetical protein
MNREGMKQGSDELVVFSILKDTVCAECGAELGPGSLLRLQKDRPLCMDCSDLGHLVLLPRGDAALTRRSRKYSMLSAVVVRFSRARGRYERQGLLVEPAALERAEVECLGDEEARRAARARAAVGRERADERYREEFAARIRQEYPGCPDREATTIAEHACEKYSGRVGRSASARELEATAIELAVRAHVRHVHTAYDRLLARGRERDEARAEVAGEAEQVLARWRRPITASRRPGLGVDSERR